MTEQMVIQKVQMSTRQTLDLGQRGIHRLRVETLATGEKRVLVAEVAMVRAAARDHDGVRYQIARALDQITPYRWRPQQGACLGRVSSLQLTGARIGQQARKDLLTRPQAHGICVLRGFVRQRGHMQATEGDPATACAVEIGNLVGPIGVGDVHLDHHQFRIVVEAQGFHMLVDQSQFIGRLAISREGRQPQRRKQRILDRPEVGAGRFGQCRQDELDTHEAMLIPVVAQFAPQSGRNRTSWGDAEALRWWQDSQPRGTANACRASPASESGDCRTLGTPLVM